MEEACEGHPRQAILALCPSAPLSLYKPQGAPAAGWARGEWLQWAVRASQSKKAAQDKTPPSTCPKTAGEGSQIPAAS